MYPFGQFFFNEIAINRPWLLVLNAFLIFNFEVIQFPFTFQGLKTDNFAFIQCLVSILHFRVSKLITLYLFSFHFTFQGIKNYSAERCKYFEDGTAICGATSSSPLTGKNESGKIGDVIENAYVIDNKYVEDCSWRFKNGNWTCADVDTKPGVFQCL